MRGRHGVVAAAAIFACGGPQSGETLSEHTYEGETEVEVEAIPDADGLTAAGGEAVDSRDPGTFPRDQPHVVGMQKWNGTYIVQSDQLYSVDLGAGEAHPLVLPGADEVLSVTSQGTSPVALVKRGDGRVLFTTAGDRWIEKPLPEVFRPATAPVPILAGDAGSLVLLGIDRVHRLRGTAWTSVAVAAMPREMRGAPTHLLLAGDRLYLGWDSGEWGGALLVLDTATGQWSVGPDSGTPVHDIERGPDGAVWIANGLAHLGGRRGALHRHDGAAWTSVAATSNAQHEPNHDWNLPPDSFQSIAFAADGSLHVLTGTLGIVKRDPAGTFHQRTRSWPASRYLYVEALGLEGEQAVIASSDAGVWLWDLGSGAIRRVVLRAPTPAPTPTPATPR